MAIDYDRWDVIHQPNHPLRYRAPGNGEESDDSKFDDEDDSKLDDEDDSPAPEHNDQLENIDFDFDEHCEVERREY